MSDESCRIDDDETGSIFEWFDPNGFPRLKEAVRIMLLSVNAMTNGITPHKGSAEAGFATEMKEG